MNNMPEINRDATDDDNSIVSASHGNLLLPVQCPTIEECRTQEICLSHNLSAATPSENIESARYARHGTISSDLLALIDREMSSNSSSLIVIGAIGALIRPAMPEPIVERNTREPHRYVSITDVLHVIDSPNSQNIPPPTSHRERRKKQRHTHVIPSHQRDARTLRYGNRNHMGNKRR